MDALHRALSDARQQVAALEAARAELVAASEGSNADDEHDPEGATIAFEREQLSALIAQARATVRSLDAAVARRAQGDYGTCTLCGAAIAAERLAARPQADRCITCARPR